MSNLQNSLCLTFRTYSSCQVLIFLACPLNYPSSPKYPLVGYFFTDEPVSFLQQMYESVRMQKADDLRKSLNNKCYLSPNEQAVSLYLASQCSTTLDTCLSSYKDLRKYQASRQQLLILIFLAYISQSLRCLHCIELLLSSHGKNREEIITVLLNLWY